MGKIDKLDKIVFIGFLLAFYVIGHCISTLYCRHSPHGNDGGSKNWRVDVAKLSTSATPITITSCAMLVTGLLSVIYFSRSKTDVRVGGLNGRLLKRIRVVKGKRGQRKTRGSKSSARYARQLSRIRGSSRKAPITSEALPNLWLSSIQPPSSPALGHPLAIHTSQLLIKKPIDLSSRVVLKAGPPFTFGEFASMHLGRLGRTTVVVKVLQSNAHGRNLTVWETEMKKHLRRESMILSSLKHRNIVRFYGYIASFGSLPAFVLEYCLNGNAGAYLERKNSLTAQKRLRLVWDVAEGLAYLHANQIIHNDLNPMNILVDKDGVAKICGFARVYLPNWPGFDVNTKSLYCPSVRYKAPELLSRIKTGNEDPTPSFPGDMYSLGCIAYEFVQSKRPYSELETNYELLYAIDNNELPASRPTRREDHFSNSFWDFLHACWDPLPRRRPNVHEGVAKLTVLSSMCGD